MTRVLIVAPALNEATVLPEFIDAFLRLRAELASGASLRLLVVDDGSTDETLAVLRGAAARWPDLVAYLSFAANAGHQAALIAGLWHAGEWPDAVVTMDADLEHPMAVVPRLIDVWRKTGAVAVHAVRNESRDLPWLKRVPSNVFYRLTAALTSLPLVPGQADFRLWDAATIRGIRDYLPHIGSLRVFAAWLPGRKESVSYEQQVREHRRTRFTLRKNYELAAISIIRFSHFPLRAITAIGAVGLVFGFVYAAFIAVAVVRGRTVPGWSSLILTVLIMGCLQLIALGIFASYVRRLVFARDLPPFVVRESRLVGQSEPVGVPRS
jgi:dolichol-phosphate mannosyltransferase